MKRVLATVAAALVMTVPAVGPAAPGDYARSFQLSMYGHDFRLELGVHSTGGFSSNAAEGCATLLNTATNFLESFCGTMRLSADPLLATGSTSGVVFSTGDPSRLLTLSFNWTSPASDLERVEDTGDLTTRRTVRVSGGFDGAWSRNDAFDRPATVQQSIQYA